MLPVQALPCHSILVVSLVFLSKPQTIVSLYLLWQAAADDSLSIVETKNVLSPCVT